jgi:hypothetical protein
MFVREKGRGGVAGAFLPGVDVFSVQVIGHFLPKHETITEISQRHLPRHLFISSHHFISRRHFIQHNCRLTGKRPL